jgi:signal transduction histidine kinase
MNQFLPADALMVDPGPRENPSRCASGAVYEFLATTFSDPQGLEDWLGELAKALGARQVALVAFSDNETVVRDFFPKETAVQPPASWPWEHDRQFVDRSRMSLPAMLSRSADGCSSFLAVAVQHNGFLWILCLEDASNREWSVDEQAALALAASGLFQFAPVRASAQKWAAWSEKVRTQQRLEDAAAVVARLAHDFNNVLTSVLGFTELSLAHLPPSSSHRKLMAEVYTAAQQGSGLINQLGLFSTRRKVSYNTTTSLGLLLEEEKNHPRKAWSEAITLEIHVPPALPALSIDAEALRVILDKLLENAREAISNTGTVSVSGRRVELTAAECLALLGKTCPGSYVEIAVADTGCGFSAEARKRVWTEPFFSTKPRHRGLGLVSVYGVLMNHGGGIHLDFGQDSGTQVRVYLPASPCAAEVSPSGPAVARPAAPGSGEDERDAVAVYFPARTR